MKSRTLKLNQLKEGCKDQVKLFKKLFGRKVDVTVALAKKHYKKFDWGWAAYNLLTALASVEYRKMIDSALAEYKKTAWGGYSLIDTEFKKVRNSARARFEKMTASAWAKAYINDK